MSPLPLHLGSNCMSTKKAPIPRHIIPKNPNGPKPIRTQERHPRLSKRAVTREEVEKRVDSLVTILANTPNLTRYKLHTVYCAKWKVHYSTVDRYLELAKKELLDRMGRKKEEFTANSVAFYESVISDRRAQYKDRLRAQARLDELLGLKSPTRVELSGVGGTPLQLESKAEVHLDGLTVEELRAAIAFAEQKAPADNKGT